MRGLKFRAWDKKNKRMGKVLQLSLDESGILGGWVDFGNDSAQLLFDEAEWMQFTGLTDKNGKEIYEGDILHWLAIEVKTSRIVVDETVQVKWSDDATRFYVEKRGIFENVFQGRTRWWPVIGNIHENPELLSNLFS